MTTEPRTIDQEKIPSSNLTLVSKKGIIKEKLEEALNLLKPTILNVILTFAIFIILLAAVQKLSVATLVAISAYLLIAFLIQPLIVKKTGKKFGNFNFGSSKNQSSIVPTTNNSIVLYTNKKELIGISLLNVEYFTNYVQLNTVWDLFVDEGIHIQDCREGCYLVIRKSVPLKKSKTLVDSATHLIKEMERTILLTKKKFDLEFDNLNLTLVKNQERICMILNLGLYQTKFGDMIELSEEELDYIRKSTKLRSDNQKKEKLLA